MAKEDLKWWVVEAYKGGEESGYHLEKEMKLGWPHFKEICH